MPRRSFVRARKPEEKEVRRQAILKAARALLDEHENANDLSLNELARRAGISKPNVYRYFESREEVLLQLWVDEVRLFTELLEKGFTRLKTPALDPVVRVIVDAFVASPRMCELTAMCSPVLERNLSADAIAEAKLTLAQLVVRTAQLMNAVLPEISLEDCSWLVGAIATWVAGIWPSVNPTEATREALARPELAAMRIDFPRDLKRFVQTLVAGLNAS
jgi:AcrR family transcriptional regulator